VSTEPLIAVIDDDEPSRTAIKESLIVLGYCAQGFASADEFLAAGDERSYDCIITDIHMPGINGFDLKRRLTARGFATPVIMITARTEPGLEEMAAELGAVCLLRKPFESDTLTGFLKATMKIRPTGSNLH
jgi:FixJ family two-component response regulator